MLPNVNMQNVVCAHPGRSRLPPLTSVLWALVLAALAAAPAGSQTPSAGAASAAPTSQQPIVITLDEAIRRAESSEPAYTASKAASQSAALDRSIALAGLLPNARYYSQGIYTQPNGIYAEGGEGLSSPDPKFVANDSRPREYIAQGIVDETLSLAGPAAVRRAYAAAAMARAELEIARRGLVATVTDLFYSLLAADRKQAIAETAYKNAADFTALTMEREQQREAAHADVIKAQLTEQQQWRGLQDAKLAAETSRLELGVLLFPDPRTPYTLKADETVAPLVSFVDVQAAAAKNNPELKSAFAALDASNADVLSARAALLPSLGLNVTYGIDANEFAVNGPMTPSGLQARNLGYSASLTLNIPVWDWLSTEHKVKQSEIRRDTARVLLSATQRQLIAQLRADYAAAQTAQDELASLDLSVKTSAESLRLTELRYKNGEALVLEVVDAQNTYVTAQNARQDGLVRYESALAALQTLTGTM
ncbi:MAG TPA: TolC family protein [Terracidiphilus sp.]|nr:TolC family protein [Terracidiphilus sp.]